MKAKILYIILFINFTYLLFSQNKLPIPKDYKLYTDFVCYKKTKYLKKETITTGYIAMDGKNKFIYKQINPFVIEIRKRNNTILYKRENFNEITIEISDTNHNDVDIFIISLFNSEEKDFENNFFITKEVIKDYDYYKIIPKNTKYIKEIKAKGIDDKLTEIIITYIDNSLLRYEFKNVKTGKSIDENLF